MHTEERKLLPMLIVLYGGMFIAAFNENIINVALVKIMAEFSISARAAQWLVTGYMLVTASIVPVMAFLSRRFTLRQVYFEGCLFLGIGSLIALKSETFGVLVIARLVQAIGTGIFIPLVMTTILAIVPHNRVGTYISIGGCAITLGPALAPAVAGVLVTVFGWRSVFLMPAMVIGVLAIGGIIFLRNTNEPVKMHLDVPSVILSTLGLTCIVFGLTQISNATIAASGKIVTGLAFLGIFALRQRQLKTPVLNLSPLKNPRFSIACVLSIVAMMTSFSMSVLLPIYYEAGLGVNSFWSGLMLLAPIAVNSCASVFGGRTMDKIGEWPLLPAGFLVIVVGQIGTFFFGYNAMLVPVLVGSIIAYAGVGAIFSPSQAAGLRTLLHEQHPHGVAILNTFIQIAACIGPALFIGILSTVSENELLAGSEVEIAQAHGFSIAVVTDTVIAFVGLIVAFFYAKRK